MGCTSPPRSSTSGTRRATWGCSCTTAACPRGPSLPLAGFRSAASFRPADRADLGTIRPRMGRIDDRLKELGITLPPVRAPMANYVPARRVGNLVYTAGQVSGNAEREFKGKLGKELTVEQGREA